jgi:hypothetical protein
MKIKLTSNAGYNALNSIIGVAVTAKRRKTFCGNSVYEVAVSELQRVGVKTRIFEGSESITIYQHECEVYTIFDAIKSDWGCWVVLLGFVLYFVVVGLRFQWIELFSGLL